MVWYEKSHTLTSLQRISSYLLTGASSRCPCSTPSRSSTSSTRRSPTTPSSGSPYPKTLALTDLSSAASPTRPRTPYGFIVKEAAAETCLSPCLSLPRPASPCASFLPAPPPCTRSGPLRLDRRTTCIETCMEDGSSGVVHPWVGQIVLECNVFKTKFVRPR